MSSSTPPPDPAAMLNAVNGWRADPDQPIACPACGTEGLTITDRSARPYAEWYHLACTACGLDHTLHIAMPGPAPGG